jgi:methionine-rich copper-binding protein CopC
VPDVSGLQYWVTAQRDGMELADIAVAFTQSVEFAQSAQSSDTSFLTALYQNALGRAPDASGLAYWNAQLASGMSRDQVLSSISTSGESAATNGVKAQIVLAYNGLLGRTPTTAEVETIVQGQGQKSLVELIKSTADALLLNPPVTPHVTPTPSAPLEATFTPKAGSTANSSDASAAVALDSKYMIVGDDEANVLRVYDRAGGDAVYEWDYSQAIGINGEVDLEAAVMIGDTLYLTGSHSNTKKGVDADSREVIFSVKVSGTGANTTFTYQSDFKGLEAALVQWDQTGASGKATNYFGFAASSGAGISPENTNGFSIEGMTTSLDDSALWLGFRAPQTDTTTRDKALIVPVENYQALLSGSAPAPQFGAAIELNLGGRGIRSIEKAADGSGYLIIAGPSGTASNEVTHDFRLFTWNGDAATAPVELSNNLDALLKSTGGSFESIVSLSSIKPGTQIQLLQDNGDTIWPGQTEVSKDLAPALQQFKGNLITLGAAAVDTAAPVLVAATPSDKAVDVAASSSLALVFDEGVTLGAGTIQLQKTNGDMVESFAIGDPGVKVDFNKITLQPSAKLLTATDYKLVLSADAVTDHSGNSMAARTIDFKTGEATHYDLLITEVNSNATGDDFFELYNYGSTTINLSGWGVDDDSAQFGEAIGLPANLTLGAGEKLVIAKATDDATLQAFKTAWGLDSSVKVIGLNLPGLGKDDAVVLFDSAGNVATAFSYKQTEVTASDGTVITHALSNGTFVGGEHAGKAFGSTATASAIWDGVSTTDPHYVGAVAGQLGSYAQTAKPESVGSPGLIGDIVLTGNNTLDAQALAA